jgi:plasmid segregation protein ParM
VDIVGIDTGKYQTKYVCSSGIGSFKSKIYPYRSLRVENHNDDFTIEFKREKYFGGDLGEREGYIPINYKDESKLHVTTLINVLSALHKIGDTKYKIVVGSPISKRTEKEKEALKEMLKGTHKISLNGVEKEITILECEVSPEGAAGFYSQPQRGIIQGLDFGSTTINYFYMENMKFIDKRSGTFPIDSEFKDYEGIMKGIHSQLIHKFGDYPTMILGGLSKDYEEYVKRYYPKSFVVINPIMASAIGFYKIAKGLYS